MKGLFVSVFAILLIFNILYIQVSPQSTLDIYVGALTGLVASTVAVGILGGVQILGSGLNSESIKILFGTSTLLNILFSINVAGFPIGLGLATNIIEIFSSDGVGGIGFIIATLLSSVGLVSGLMVIIGGGD